MLILIEYMLVLFNIENSNNSSFDFRCDFNTYTMMFIRKMIEKRKGVKEVESLNDVMEFEDDTQEASDIA